MHRRALSKSSNSLWSFGSVTQQVDLCFSLASTFYYSSGYFMQHLCHDKEHFQNSPEYRQYIDHVMPFALAPEHRDRQRSDFLD